MLEKTKPETLHLIFLKLADGFVSYNSQKQVNVNDGYLQ